MSQVAQSNKINHLLFSNINKRQSREALPHKLFVLPRHFKSEILSEIMLKRLN